MKIETHPQDTHELKLTVEIETEVLETAKRKAAKKLAKKVKIPGFRPGKAPYNRVLSFVGEGAVIDDAFNILIEDIYPKVLEEKEINLKDAYGFLLESCEQAVICIEVKDPVNTRAAVRAAGYQILEKDDLYGL